MYIHIGGNAVVRDCDIVGIFDIDNCSTGQKTRGFFAKNQQSGKVVDATDDLPKSFLVTADPRHRRPDGKPTQTKVYISGVATATLRSRVTINDRM